MRHVGPSRVDGSLAAPPSKSDAIRLVAAAALAEGSSVIENFSPCDDAEAALFVAKSLGARVVRSSGSVSISGGELAPRGALDCGESGLSLRLFAPIAALCREEVELLGRGSLLWRSAAMLEAPLEALGASCRTRDGLPPVWVRGPLLGGTAEVDGSATSQHVSGLILALPRCERDSEVVVRDLKSAPYAKMTLDVARRFGAEIEATAGCDRLAVRGGQRYRAISCRVEGDWSSAAFLLVAGATAGRVSEWGLDPASSQPDRAILGALEAAGAALEITGGAVTASRGDLRAFSFDATDCPDLFPPLAALACHCRGTTVLRGASRLRAKESDRAQALRSELGRMGARVGVDGDEMLIESGEWREAKVDPHGDHRNAMACATAALAATRGVGISKTECVRKSYPGFFDDLAALGARIG